MNFREEAERTEGYILEQRRYFHRYPELSFEERETTRAIARQLERFGLAPHTFSDYTGLYADIEGNEAGGSMVVLRADIDALPVTERTGLPFASRREGIMHACGHDCHTAMLLGAAKMLSAHRNKLKGRVRLLFQAAEESCHGARYYADLGLIDGARAVYGSHVWGDLDSPGINIEAGERMTSCDNFTITVTGVSAHGATPDQGIDAITAACAVVLALQTLVSRRCDPRHSLAISVGEFTGGRRFNIVADRAVLKGTVRTHSLQIRGKVEEWIRQAASCAARANGAQAFLQYEYDPDPVINDAGLTRIAREAAVKLYGEQILVPMEKSMLSEDFSYLTRRAPGVFAFIGARCREKGITAGNHHECFTVDEEVLKRGTALYAQFAWDVLEGQR